MKMIREMNGKMNQKEKVLPIQQVMRLKKQSMMKTMMDFSFHMVIYQMMN
jgi:hypothetical protein